jgi:hypothetical protein
MRPGSTVEVVNFRYDDVEDVLAGVYGTALFHGELGAKTLQTADGVLHR